MYSGHTIDVRVEDPRLVTQGVSGATVTLYDYGAYVTGNTIQGTVTSGLSSGNSISGKTDYYGFVRLDDVPPGVFSVAVVGVGYPVQILSGYERLEMGPLIRGAPDYLQMNDSTGGTHYVYVTTGGTLAVTDVLS